MTDFAKPTTPGDVLRDAARQMEYREKRLRRDAEKLLAQAEELVVARMDIERDADRYDQYQPSVDNESASTAQGGGVVIAGTCGACGGAAEQGPSGAWWHLGTSCWAKSPISNYVKAVFVPLASSPATSPVGSGSQPVGKGEETLR